MGQHEYTFPKNLRRIRKARGLSQKELAKNARISQACISEYENRIKYPAVDKIYDIARVLGVSVDELISDKDEAE